MNQGSSQGDRPALLEEELVAPLVELFSTAWALDTCLRSIAGSILPNELDSERLVAAFLDVDVRELRLRFPRCIDSVESLLSRLPQPVFDAVAEVGRIHRATRQQAVSMPDYVLVALRMDLGAAGRRGRLAIQQFREKNAHICDWAVETSGKSNATGMTNTLPNTAIINESQIGQHYTRFTQTDFYPLTTEGHNQFLELVRDEVQEAAENKRRRVEKQYDNATVDSIVRSVRWEEAQARFGLISDPDLPTDVLTELRSVLKWPFTRGTIEQVEERLVPAIARLRAAWQQICDAGLASPTAPSASSLVTLIERTIRRLSSAPDLLRVYPWEHSAGLNAGQINHVAAKIPVGPIFAFSEAADWARSPHFTDDPPNNSAKVDCLTVFHPDRNDYRICRTGGLLDDTLRMDVDEAIARLDAWRQCAATVLLPAGNERCIVEEVIGCHAKPVTRQMAAAVRDEPAKVAVQSSAKVAAKRSTERGEARAKLIAALTKHH